jgi:hypothetical protein
MPSPSRATVLRAGALYFAIVFGAGFLLAFIRIPLLVPRFGERIAELLEMPVMVAVIFIASRHVVRRFGLTTRAAIAAGLLALALIVTAELTVAALTGRSVTDRDPVAGGVYLAALLLYAALPWLHARRIVRPAFSDHPDRRLH